MPHAGSLLFTDGVLPFRKLVRQNVETAKRYYSARAQRLVGVPPLEETKPSEYDGFHMVMCPFSRTIRRYMKSLGHCVTFLIPCGHCLKCMHMKQNQLIYRMYNHSQMYKNAIFVTLTYAPTHYVDDIAVLRDDITKFIKRFRKEFHDPTFTYYMVCERGDLRNRAHFHLLFWWNGDVDIPFVCNLVRSKWYGKVRNLSSIDELYNLVSTNSIPYAPIGIVYIDTQVNNNVSAYVSKYVTGVEKKLLFRSWSLGLGADILASDPDLVAKLRYCKSIQYVPSDKVYRVAVPQYYKNKVFSQSERDCLFQDYLVSDDYQNRVSLINDTDKWVNLLEVYKNYEKRTLDAYHAKVLEKKAKKRLL